MHSFTNVLVALSVAATTLGSHVHHVQVRHNALSKRMEEETSLTKRFAAHRVTWYPTNTGPDACTGRNHGDYDNIVALNIPQWGNLNARSQYCGRRIRITANGKTHDGVIQDACASCYNFGEIDLTLGLFEKFESRDKGVFDATWYFVDGNDGPPPPPPPPPPPVKKPVKKPDPAPAKPTPPPAKVVDKQKKKSSSKSKSKTSTKKSSSAKPSKTSTPAPPPTPTETGDGVLNPGSNPTGLSGGISSGKLNGASTITFNKFVAGAAALVLAVHAL